MKLLVIHWCIFILFPVLGFADNLKGSSTVKAESFTFCGVVQSVDPVPVARGHSYIPVDIDPQFVLMVKTAEVLQLGLPSRYDENRTQAFGIHSPTHLFLADVKDVIGQKFGFVYSKAERRGEPGKLEIKDCADHVGVTNDRNGQKSAK